MAAIDKAMEVKTAVESDQKMYTNLAHKSNPETKSKSAQERDLEVKSDLASRRHQEKDCDSEDESEMPVKAKRSKMESETKVDQEEEYDLSGEASSGQEEASTYKKSVGIDLQELYQEEEEAGPDTYFSDMSVEEASGS